MADDLSKTSDIEETTAQTIEIEKDIQTILGSFQTDSKKSKSGKTTNRKTEQVFRSPSLDHTQQTHLRIMTGNYCKNQQCTQEYKSVLKCLNAQCEQCKNTHKDCSKIEYGKTKQYLNNPYEKHLQEIMQRKMAQQFKLKTNRINSQFEQYLKQKYKEKISQKEIWFMEICNGRLSQSHHLQNLNPQELRNFDELVNLIQLAKLQKQKQLSQEEQKRHALKQSQKQIQDGIKSTLNEFKRFNCQKMKEFLKDVRTQLSQYLNSLRIKTIKQEQLKIMKSKKIQAKSKQSIEYHKLELFQKIIIQSNTGITVANLQSIFGKIDASKIQSIQIGFQSNNYKQNIINQYIVRFEEKQKTLFICLGHDQSINGAGVMIPLQITESIEKWQNQTAIIYDKTQKSFVFYNVQNQPLRQGPIEYMILHQDSTIIWLQTEDIKHRSFILSDFQKYKQYLYWQAWHIKQFDDNKSKLSKSSKSNNSCKNSKIFDSDDKKHVDSQLYRQAQQYEKRNQKILDQMSSYNKQSMTLNCSDLKNELNSNSLSNQTCNKSSIVPSEYNISGIEICQEHLQISYDQFNINNCKLSQDQNILEQTLIASTINLTQSYSYLKNLQNDQDSHQQQNQTSNKDPYNQSITQHSIYQKQNNLNQPTIKPKNNIRINTKTKNKNKNFGQFSAVQGKSLIFQDSIQPEAVQNMTQQLKQTNKESQQLINQNNDTQNQDKDKTKCQNQKLKDQ